MNKTFNPFKIVGSYLGILAGYYFSIKGMNVFGFVLYYINVSVTSLLIANMIGGFIVGYAFHVFIRAFAHMGILGTFTGKGEKKQRDIGPQKGL